MMVKKAKATLLTVMIGVGALAMSSCQDNEFDCVHSYGPWTISKVATCEEEGEKTRSCVKRGYTQTEIIAAKGHNFSNGICTVCGKPER